MRGIWVPLSRFCAPGPSARGGKTERRFLNQHRRCYQSLVKNLLVQAGFGRTTVFGPICYNGMTALKLEELYGSTFSKLLLRPQTQQPNTTTCDRLAQTSCTDRIFKYGWTRQGGASRNSAVCCRPFFLKAWGRNDQAM